MLCHSGWPGLCVWLVVVSKCFALHRSVSGWCGVFVGVIPVVWIPAREGWGLFLTESLILAQDERWRRALHMQVER